MTSEEFINTFICHVSNTLGTEQETIRVLLSGEEQWIAKAPQRGPSKIIPKVGLGFLARNPSAARMLSPPCQGFFPELRNAFLGMRPNVNSVASGT